MPDIGTPPTDRILTSEDIEAGAVEMSDISWKNQPANENISGTIDSFTVKLAEKFTLTGDIAISKDLTLTKLADDGEALVLTTDASSRTIEGSGTISSNTFAQVPNASLTSMTGVLGSGVTGGSGLSLTGMTGTIGSSVVFPTGTPIQYATSRIEGGSRGHNTKTIANRSEIHSDYRSSIIPKGANSKILIRYSSRATYVNNNSAHWAIGYEVTASGGTATASTLKDQLVAGEADDEDSYFITQHADPTYRALTIEVFHTPSYTVGQKIWYGVISYATGWHYIELNGDIDIVITEIAG